MTHSLGRLYAPDPKDHPATRKLPARVELAPYLYWHTRWVGDQDDRSQTGYIVSACTGFAARGFLEAAPAITHDLDPFDIYRRAREHDEFPGEDYEGSTVRGVMKYLHELRRIGEYVFAWGLQPVLEWLTAYGPVVLGTDWTWDMFTPDAQGVVRDTGGVAGGHAYVCIGYSLTRQALRCVNSWGREWAQAGRFWLPFDVAERLIAAQGEAAMTIEIIREKVELAA
jgi:hypothetical protein